MAGTLLTPGRPARAATLCVRLDVNEALVWVVVFEDLLRAGVALPCRRAAMARA